MTAHADIKSLVAVTPVPDLGRDAYANALPLTSQEGVRFVFGGFLVSQSVSAASATVPDGYRMYSSQSSFLKPADARAQVVYRVDRTADGASYATRTVKATQGETCVYVAIVSFQNAARPAAAANALRYGLPPPELDGARPEDVDPDDMQSMQDAMLDKSVPLMQLSAEERPFDWRPHGMEMSGDPSQFRLRGFVRAPPLDAGPGVHLAALAYMSDEFSFGPALAADPVAIGKGFRNLAMGASLTHNVQFHDPKARVDRWLVLERDTTWAAEGRALVSQRFWDLETGSLVMSGTQEALIRLKPKTPKDTKL